MLHMFTLRSLHHHPLTTVHVISQHNLLVSADISGLLVIWNLSTRKALYSRQFEVQILAVSCLNTMLFVQFRDAQFLVFRLEPASSGWRLTEAPVKRLACAEYSFCKHIAISVSSRVYLVVPVNGGLQVLDCNADFDVLLDDFEHINEHGTMMAIACNNTGILGVGFEDGHVLLYDLTVRSETAKVLRSFAKILPDSITCLQFATDTDLMVGGATKNLLAVNTDTGHQVSTATPFRDHGISALLVLDDSTILSGGWDGKLRTFQLTKQAQTLHQTALTQDHHYDTITDLQRARLHTPIPGGSLLQTANDIVVSAGKDCIINIWRFT